MDFTGKRGPYRARDGIILGVCKGLANYFDFSVFWLRIIMVIILFLSGLWPIIAVYIIASLLMKPEPISPFRTEAERDFYDSYMSSNGKMNRQLKRRYEKLDRRIRRMEDAVTGRDFRWEQKMKA
jgi:phage shock protein C